MGKLLVSVRSRDSRLGLSLNVFRVTECHADSESVQDFFLRLGIRSWDTIDGRLQYDVGDIDLAPRMPRFLDEGLLCGSRNHIDGVLDIGRSARNPVDGVLRHP